MPVADVRIDEALWEPATRLRRQEWRTLVADLLDDSTFFPEGPHVHLAIAARGGAARVLVTDEAGGFVLELVVPRERLAPFVDEYMGIVRNMVADDVHPSRLEALDMAKKVVHDKAARLLAEDLSELAGEHDAFRRLFSLVVALLVDTTSVPLAHRHAAR